jgi:hypothetical protein
LRGKCASGESLLAVGFVDHADISAWQIAQRIDTRPCLVRAKSGAAPVLSPVMLVEIAQLPLAG